MRLVEFETVDINKLDDYLAKLCSMIKKGKEERPEYYGMVAAGVLTPKGKFVAKINYPKGKLRVHAERAAIEEYTKYYGKVPQGSIIVTTLSPCNEMNDETAEERVGMPCTDFINHNGIRQVYSGYKDPTQDNEHGDYKEVFTKNKQLRTMCKSFADTFLKDIEEDYSPDVATGPETPPTMPAGTVRVDVSDVYDWYKLGKSISNLKRAKASDFGKGPPSTIMSFGSEEEEHKYINHLKKLGLTTTDIDPLDPNQPKGMPRQKVDPTYNVGENFADGKHPEDKGDSKRYKVPTKASVSTLRKVAKQGGRKGQLAHWMANMKAGKNK